MTGKDGDWSVYFVLAFCYRCQVKAGTRVELWLLKGVDRCNMCGIAGRGVNKDMQWVLISVHFC